MRLIQKNECFFKKITPALAKRQPQYAPFLGLFLVTESTDRLDAGAIVSDLMVFAEKLRLAGSPS
jgi:hypothetical protein